MNNDFFNFINNIQQHDLVAFVSNKYYDLDVLSHTLQLLIPHKYRKADGFKELNYILDESYVNSNNNYIIDMVSRKDAMTKINYKPSNKTNFIFIPIYNINNYNSMTQNMKYSIPRSILYSADAVYTILNNRIDCLKNRIENPNFFIKFNPEIIFRKEKIKKLLQL